MCQSEFIHLACYIPESVCVCVCVRVHEGPQMCVSECGSCTSCSFEGYDYMDMCDMY